MKNYDSHIHIGTYEENKIIIQNSEYKNKYKLYSLINPEMLNMQEEYTKMLDDFFAIPLFFKETNIERCNQFVINYCKKNNKGIPVLLIDKNDKFIGDYSVLLFKEHFLVNDFLDWRDRSKFYDFLNDNEGYLLIHCKDKIRVEYIKNLLINFPKMNIIIAHLGRDTYEMTEFIRNILLAFAKNDNVLFDISTIHNVNNILYALNIVGEDRILYGSDFPFEYESVEEIYSLKKKLLNCLNNNEHIFVKNFEKIRNKVYVRK